MTDAATTPGAGGAMFGRIVYQIRHNPMTMIGMGIVGFMVLISLAAPLLTPYDPNHVDLTIRLLPPSLAHPAGTDEAGRDILARILYGGRTSILSGIGVVAIGGSIGALIGAFSGYVGGRTDQIIMRLMDIAMALPSLVIALALAAALGPSLLNAVIALGILSVPFYSRIARGQTLAIRELDYIRAARVMGAGNWHQLRKHVIPNVASPILVYVTLDIGNAILAFSALSFIGLGVQPPTAEWGALVNAGRAFILEEWWYAVFPGAAIMITVLGFNLMGDGLRDLADPRAQKR